MEREKADTLGWREDGSGQGEAEDTDQPRLCAGRDDGGAARGDRHFMQRGVFSFKGAASIYHKTCDRLILHGGYTPPSPYQAPRLTAVSRKNILSFGRDYSRVSLFMAQPPPLFCTTVGGGEFSLGVVLVSVLGSCRPLGCDWPGYVSQHSTWRLASFTASFFGDFSL